MSLAALAAAIFSKAAAVGIVVMLIGLDMLCIRWCTGTNRTPFTKIGESASIKLVADDVGIGVFGVFLVGLRAVAINSVHVLIAGPTIDQILPH